MRMQKKLIHACLGFWPLVVLLVLPAAPAAAQSGAVGRAPSGRELGANLTVAVYQYDAARSPAMQPVTRLPGTFSTALDEMRYMKETYKLDGLDVRHIRSVGLRNDETFEDAVALGPEYLHIAVTPRRLQRGSLEMEVRVRYGEATLLEASGVAVESFETVLLSGGKAMFGVKYFVGPGGRQESVPVERTLLLSVTPEIAPLASLRNRPRDLSRPVDEYGSPVSMAPGDRFTPPVATERVTPTFDAARPLNGSVLVTCVVTPDGRATNIRVLRSLEPQIDERAVEALRKFRFSPGRLNGKPVYATYREEITFIRQPTPAEILDEMQKQIDREKEKEKKRP